jgi:hypothetical protein
MGAGVPAPPKAQAQQKKRRTKKGRLRDRTRDIVAPPDQIDALFYKGLDDFVQQCALMYMMSIYPPYTPAGGLPPVQN